MKIYCQNCGKPTEYSAMNKPNFCFNCGGSFGSGASSTASQAQQAVQTSDVPEDDEVLSVPNIDKLQVDIDVQEATPIKIEHLLGTAEGGVSEPPRGHSGLSDEELVQSFLKEGSALRGKQRPESDG